MDAYETGWKDRAERVVGPLELYASPTLSASEIGQFSFCPQAWFLGRCDIPVDARARARLESGTHAHRRIGRRTDLVRTTEQFQRVLLAVMIVLAIIAAVVAIRGDGL